MRFCDWRSCKYTKIKIILLVRKAKGQICPKSSLVKGSILSKSAAAFVISSNIGTKLEIFKFGDF